MQPHPGIDLGRFEQLQKPLHEIADHGIATLSKFGETKNLWDMGYHVERLRDGTEIVLLGNLYRRDGPVDSFLLIERRADKAIFLVPESEFGKLRDPREVERVTREATELADSLNAQFREGRLPGHLRR